jgi:pimeloyl-ACP methyl ester carboxylesterase
MTARLDESAELFYPIDGFTDPWTRPETMVLHHGVAKNRKPWYAWVPILAQHYRVVHFDMRGMGQSSVPEPGYPLDEYGRGPHPRHAEPERRRAGRDPRRYRLQIAAHCAMRRLRTVGKCASAACALSPVRWQAHHL